MIVVDHVGHQTPGVGGFESFAPVQDEAERAALQGRRAHGADAGLEWHQAGLAAYDLAAPRQKRPVGLGQFARAQSHDGIAVFGVFHGGVLEAQGAAIIAAFTRS